MYVGMSDLECRKCVNVLAGKVRSGGLEILSLTDYIYTQGDICSLVLSVRAVRILPTVTPKRTSSILRWIAPYCFPARLKGSIQQLTLEATVSSSDVTCNTAIAPSKMGPFVSLARKKDREMNSPSSSHSPETRRCELIHSVKQGESTYGSLARYLETDLPVSHVEALGYVVHPTIAFK
jgi:hypothetical protein